MANENESQTIKQDREESPPKVALNPFRIRDTEETRIVPDAKKDDKLHLKAPNILKQSNNMGLNSDLIASNTNTEGVFYTDRDCTSARNRVDFDLNSSQEYDYTSSLMDSNPINN